MLESFKKDFPILNTKDNRGNKLVYLDSASTTQKPDKVISAVSNYYERLNANIHRGAYKLSVDSTILYDETKEVVRRFINAKSPDEIIFTKGTTEALNLLAYTYGENNINADDEIVVTILEHHSNLLPWQQLAIRKKAKLVFMYCDESGQIPLSELSKITAKTKIVSVTGMSNVFGTSAPIKEITKKARNVGAITIVDAAQLVAHSKTDVREMDIDFLAFSGHKILAPMGIGVLYGKKHLLDAMPPFLYGGDMVEYVQEQSATFAPSPQKFEGGTQNIASVAGLKAAIEYIENIGMDNIEKHINTLCEYAVNQMKNNKNIILYASNNTSGIIAFSIKDVHPHDTSSIIDAESNVAIRSGHHCAQPLLKHMNIPSVCRASFYLYNTKEDVDIFVNSLKTVRPWLGLGDD